MFNGHNCNKFNNAASNISANRFLVSAYDHSAVLVFVHVPSAKVKSFCDVVDTAESTAGPDF